jgi:type 2 lantibiotic biosynthesis protein LanM
MRVGLLPQRIWGNAEAEGIDISGLGTLADQLTPHGIPAWNGVGTDEMRFARKRVLHPGGKNRPSLNGMAVDVLAYANSIMTGFANMYQLLLQHRDELLVEDGPIARFSQDEVRVILRNTRTYGRLLYESFHPDVLRDALDRDRLFDRLWGRVEQLPYLARVIPAERNDLQKGDIPLFTTRPNSRDLWSSSHERIANFVDEPGLNLAQQRLRRLSDDDLAQQLWFIRASLATLSPDGDRASGPAYMPTEAPNLADRERLLAAARAVGDRLEARALRGVDDVSWIGLTLAHDRYWSLVPLGVDLYDGVPGVALFLAYLGAVTREERYTALAQAALTTLRRQVERSQSFISSIGGFTGWGGIIYTLTHLGVLWDQPGLLAEAEAVVERLPELIDRDAQLDVLDGAAGCIGSLISLYRCAPSNQTLIAASRCGNQLIAHALPMEHGIGWCAPTTSQPLTGSRMGLPGGHGRCWSYPRSRERHVFGRPRLMRSLTSAVSL